MEHSIYALIDGVSCSVNREVKAKFAAMLPSLVTACAVRASIFRGGYKVSNLGREGGREEGRCPETCEGPIGQPVQAHKAHTHVCTGHGQRQGPMEGAAEYAGGPLGQRVRCVAIRRHPHFASELTHLYAL
eukprot:1159446-Pelagomonas_calceolata.AAC.2